MAVSDAFFDPHDARPLTQVAVVIIERLADDGNIEVLFAQRPTGKAYAGYWEFPGGKIEAGESLRDSAAREIFEELGLEIHDITVWETQRFSYPHAHVQLNFCRTQAWSGAPEGREAQAFSWQRLGHITVSPLLPALHDDNDALLRALEKAHHEDHRKRVP